MSAAPIKGPIVMTIKRQALIDVQAKMLGQHAARLLFKKRGNKFEIHLSEGDLAAIVEASALVMVERCAPFIREKRS